MKLSAYTVWAKDREQAGPVGVRTEVGVNRAVLIFTACRRGPQDKKMNRENRSGPQLAKRGRIMRGVHATCKLGRGPFMLM
jgi:hypothetical protein